MSQRERKTQMTRFPILSDDCPLSTRSSRDPLLCSCVIRDRFARKFDGNVDARLLDRSSVTYFEPTGTCPKKPAHWKYYFDIFGTSEVERAKEVLRTLVSVTRIAIAACTSYLRQFFFLYFFICAHQNFSVKPETLKRFFTIEWLRLF